MLNLYFYRLISFNSLFRCILKVVFASFDSLLAVSCLFGWNYDDFYPLIGINRNLSAFLVYCVLVLSISKKQYFRPILCIAFAILFSSRTLALMIIVYALIYFVYRYREFLLRKKYIFKYFLSAALLAVMLPSLLSSNLFILDRFRSSGASIEELVSSFDIDNPRLASNDSKRIVNILTGINVIRFTFPFGTGPGLANYLHSAELHQTVPTATPINRPHNLYITMIAEYGIFAFPLFFSLCLFYFFRNSSALLFSLPLFIGYFFNEYLLFPVIWGVLAIVSCELRSLSVSKES